MTDFEQKRPIRDSSLISKEDKKRMDAHPEKEFSQKKKLRDGAKKMVRIIQLSLVSQKFLKSIKNNKNGLKKI